MAPADSGLPGATGIATDIAAAGYAMGRKAGYPIPGGGEWYPNGGGMGCANGATGTPGCGATRAPPPTPTPFPSPFAPRGGSPRAALGGVDGEIGCVAVDATGPSRRAGLKSVARALSFAVAPTPPPTASYSATAAFAASARCAASIASFAASSAAR